MCSIEQLRKAHYAAARIVEKLGDEYLIFFERIDKELLKAQENQSYKVKALAVAQSVQIK